jgi:hypothetical protein
MMAMTLNKKKAENSSSAASSPPGPDDTVGLLSSSAPPYPIHCFGNKRSPTIKEESLTLNNKNVLVYGSARASSPCEKVKKITLNYFFKTDPTFLI